jgi:1-acyl-sn-glycerol-3-phosphate acyltransferase
MIANKYNLKVQPVVLFNTRNIVDSKSLKATPGIVKVVFLDPVQASKDSTWFEETENKMKEVFNKECKNYVA